MRVLRWTVAVVLVLLVLTVGATWQQQIARHAAASPDAIAAASTDDEVTVEDGQFLVFRPRHQSERLGVIFYPGAYTDLRGYAPTLRRVAAAGYRVVAVPMPFELSILATDRAENVLAAMQDIRHWAIIGHSVGGTSAAMFAAKHPNALDGIVIWDSYPPSFASLADFPKPVWHVHRALADGSPPESFTVQRGLFPRNSQWRPVPGGIHMNFGSFVGGGYKEDWAPTISQAAQHDLVVSATLEGLADIAKRTTP